MSAPVVYDGVRGKYEGTLFGGLKFYIQLRVPLRNDLMDKIQDNGGKVVLIEKFADVIIADHLKNDAPVGSVSWKFVDDSVKAGQIQNINNYKKHTSNTTNASRPTRTLFSTSKPTRTPFSAEDDRLLTQWVLDQERLGERPHGTKIYQEFSERHPHHSWQSWRERWVKRLSLLSHQNRPLNPPPNPFPNPAPELRELPPNPTARSRGSSQDLKLEGAPPSRRNFFTEKDDEILLKWVAKCKNRGYGLNGNNIYKTLAQRHPHHTMHSWRDRWVRHLSRMQQVDEETEISDLSEKARSPETPPLVVFPKPKEQPKQLAPVPGTSRPEPEHSKTRPGPVPPVQRVQQPAIQQSQSRPQSSKDRVLELRERSIRIKRVRLLQRLWRGCKVRRELSDAHYRLEPLIPLAKGFLARNTFKHLLQAVEQEAEEDAPLEAVDAASQDVGSFTRDQFFYQLETYQQKLLGIKPMRHIEILGEEIDLWDFWSAVTQSRPERDWDDISTLLGFDWVRNGRVSNLLKSSFERHLGEFEQLLKGYEAIEESEEDELEEEDEAEEEHKLKEEHELEEESEVDSPQQDAPAPIRRTFASSPPITGVKRARGEISSPSDLAPSPNKRQRYDLDDEISETPTKNQGGSRANGRDTAARAAWDRGIGAPSSPQWLPQLPTFHQASSSGGNFEDEVTPSQQLRSEYELSSSAQPQTTETLLPHQGKGKQPERLNPTAAMAFPPPNQVVLPNRRGPKKLPQPPRSPSSSSSSSEAFFPPIKNLIKRNGGAAQNAASSAAPRRTLPPTWSKDSLASAAPAYKPVSARTSQDIVRPSIESSRGVSARPPSWAGRSRQSHSPSAPPPSKLTEMPDIEVVKAQIEHFVALGYNVKHVNQALRATSFVVSEAGPVMERLRAGLNIPDDVPGVWTAADDQGLWVVLQTNFKKTPTDLQSIAKLEQAKRERKRLVEKHGEERMRARKAFLV